MQHAKIYEIDDVEKFKSYLWDNTMNDRLRKGDLLVCLETDADQPNFMLLDTKHHFNLYRPASASHAIQLFDRSFGRFEGRLFS